MVPALRPGDKVSLEKVSESVWSVGEMLVFNDAGTFYCHRLHRTFFREGRLYLVTRADGDVEEDQPVAVEQVLGRVVSVRRAGALRRTAWTFWWQLLRWKSQAAAALGFLH